MNSTAPPPPLPGPDINNGPGLLGGLTALEFISLSLFTARIYSRTVPRVRLWWDDLFISLAILFSIPQYTLITLSILHGLGRHNVYLDPTDAMRAEMFLFLSQPPFAWTLLCAKLCIVVMLFRILRESRPWRWFLYGIGLFQVLIVASINSFQFTLCKPLNGIWDHSVVDAVCLPAHVAQTSIYVNSILVILTDVILSLVPLTFIAQLQRPLREKIAIAVIMGLGVVASCASIYKTTLVGSYGVTGDTLMDGVEMTLWSSLEIHLAIMAACVPALKQLFEKVLGRLGLLSSRHPSNPRSGYLYKGGRIDRIPSDFWESTTSSSTHKMHPIPVTTVASPGSVNTGAESPASFNRIGDISEDSDDFLPVMK